MKLSEKGQGKERRGERGKGEVIGSDRREGSLRWILDLRDDDDDVQGIMERTG